VSPVEQFVEAARAGDIAAMHALVDWRLFGIARMLRGLQLLAEPERQMLVLRGLEDMAESERSPAPVEGRLRETALKLSVAGWPRRANAAEAAPVLARLHAPPVAPGLTAETAAQLAALRERSLDISELFVCEGERSRDRIWLALSPDGRVVPA
jgi:hypothetical protein